MKTENRNGNIVYTCDRGILTFSDCEYGKIMKESGKYRYVVMYRDSYKGNGKGEYFESKDFSRLWAEQPFWFKCTERAVYEIILTNDDVPEIIKERVDLIGKITRKSFNLSGITVPTRPNCDGRETRRTNPKAFEEWDAEVAEKTKKRDRLLNGIARLRSELDSIEHYSVSLNGIK